MSLIFGWTLSVSVNRITLLLFFFFTFLIYYQKFASLGLIAIKILQAGKNVIYYEIFQLLLLLFLKINFKFE